MGKNRNISLDFLRVVAMVAVVMIHVYSLMPSMVGIRPAAVLTGLSRWAVPVFFMISGVFLLSRPIPLRVLWGGRRILRLVLLLLLWNYFYWLLRPGPLPSFVHCTLNSGEAHMWFMYTLILMYALVPLFQPMIKAGYGWYFVGIWFIIDVLLPSVNFFGDVGLINHLKHNLLGVTFGYAGYFVLGRCLYEKMAELYKYRVVICLIGALSLLLSALMPQIGLSRFLVGGTNVLYCVSAASIFFSVVAFAGEYPGGTPKRWIRSVSLIRTVESASAMSLGVYLIHPLVLSFVRVAGLDVWALSLCPFHLVGVLLVLFITTAVSLLLSYVLDKWTLVME